MDADPPISEKHELQPQYKYPKLLKIEQMFLQTSF